MGSCLGTMLYYSEPNINTPSFKARHVSGWHVSRKPTLHDIKSYSTVIDQ